jgi:N-acetylmuramoyl-L-alanine amidase
LLVFLIISVNLIGGDLKHVEIIAKSGDATYRLFEKFELQPSNCNLDHFKEINKLPVDMSLMIGRNYKLPIIIYDYNTMSIRTTISNNDIELAKKIKAYNELMYKKGVRKNDYREDKALWVPFDYLFCETGINLPAKKTIDFELLGEKGKTVEIKDNTLEENIYYIIAGHGGPDPGAIGKYGEHALCEDEYAYDIALRLAKNLLEHSATVYMITRDKNDGIRDDAILESDKDEVFYKNKTIPLNQVSRLDLACNIVNELYTENKKKSEKKQLAINLHVDSRSSGQRIDMFFYYKPDDNKAKEIANAIKDKVEDKYNQHQKNRGYYGSVKPRNLHMLRKVTPSSVFIELGNIHNSADQRRFIVKENRQAVANWLMEGLMEVK